MAATVVTITSGKGGVGKTTTTANLGVALALLGQKVVVVDTDIGLRNLDVVMGLENRIVYDLVDVVEGGCRVRQALIKDRRVPELYLLAAAQTRDKSAVTPEQMVNLVAGMRSEFDWVLIDSPAGIEQGYKNAIAPADKVLIVTTPEVSAVRDADRVIGLVEADMKGPAKLIINRLNPAMVKRGNMMSPNDVVEILNIEVIGVVPEDPNILVSTNRGAPVAMIGASNGAGQSYRDIAHRLMGEEIPIQPLRDQNSFLGRLGRLFGG